MCLSSTRQIILVLLVLVTVYLALIPSMVSARTLFTPPTSSLTNRPWASDKNCPVHRNEALHAVMDRVCEMCHEMFSHQNPNMRVDCRSKCFRNDQFRSCLYLFKPTNKS
ncbi:hypothetical protein L596_004397 [Steinernema carpocapsae]|uniref:Uncharacterized protein n=1 Tax=Steinernema carpocapsae TaxID=34508 RepID=A0A4U8UWQ6_STECR|nr:hypothetical protein L596_004397 [Steinernema carpocapsae]